MNFYSLDGSKTNNNLFQDNQIYERFDNLTTPSNKIELFAGVPTTKSNSTDTNYQCSDNYAVSGSTLGNQINNTTLDACKSKCLDSNSQCIGFNFDTSTNTCTLKQNATSLMNSAPSNTLCIKKSAGNKNCKVTKKISNESAFAELNAIFANAPEQVKEKIEAIMKNPSNKSLEENIKNYYLMSSSEQNSLLSKLSEATDVSPEIINQNIPKLIQFVNTEDTPNYNLISTVKQLAMLQQKTNPEQKILTTPSQLPIPSESEISLTDMVTKFSQLSSEQQTQLINTISNYSGVSPDYVQKDMSLISNAIGSGQIGNAGIYNKIQSLSLSASPEQQLKSYPLNIPKVEKISSMGENNMDETNVESEMESDMNSRYKLEKMKKDQDGIFVDLGCFMNNINVLKNHSDNMMIDLSLLLSNVKSCSYVKKSKKSKISNANLGTQSPEQIVNKITSAIEMPSPDIVKLKSMGSTISVGSGDLVSHGQVLGIIKEPFDSESKTKNNDWEWDSYDYIKIIILIIILALLIFRK
jgi:hypothetical protein